MIPYANLSVKSQKLKKISIKSLERVMEHGQYINGIEVEKFENKFSQFLKKDYFTGVASGTAALFLALKAKNIGAGHEVITTPLSYLASTSAIALTGAQSVLCDVDETLCLSPLELEKAINKKTKAVILVHLYGNIGSIYKIKKICKDNGIVLIEDCAQANGSSFNGKLAGTFGDFGCFSFHPLKTLAAMGDAGGICNSDEQTINWLKMARNHGHSCRDNTNFWSHNLRMDAIQAAFLADQLPYYDKHILTKRSNQTRFYLDEFNKLIKCKFIRVPKKREKVFHSYNMFVIMVPDRPEFIKFMFNNGIEVKVHYSYTIDQLTAANQNVVVKEIEKARNYSNQIVSLPIGAHLTQNNLEYISRKIVSYFS